MTETHNHKRAREMLSSGGYGRMGGHFARANGGAAGLVRSTGYADGGDVEQDEKLVRSGIRQHDDQLHGGKQTRLHFQEGGSASGSSSRPRHDRSSRSHGDGKQPKINILIHSAPKPEGQGPMPPQMPPQPPPPPPPPRPPMGGMPPGGMPPMGAGPGGPLPPGVGGAGLPPRPPGMPMRPPGMRQGGSMGSIGRGTHAMKYGSGSGAGRLQKIDEAVPDY